MILFLAFAGVMTICFGVMAFVLSSSKSQRLVARRMASIQASGYEAGSVEALELLKVEPVTQFEWLNQLIHKYPVTRMLELRIMQADSKTTPAMLLIAAFGLAAIGFLAVSVFFNILAVQLVVAGILGYIPFGYISFKRSRRIAAFNAQLADAIDMMGRALRAGHAMTAAISIVAEQSLEPVRSEFGEVFKQQNFGLPLRDAFMQMLEHVPSQDLRVVVTGILVQKETGGNLADILDRTAHTIRERLRIQGEIKTHTAQGRMTGWILCSLPVVMLVVINILNPGYSKVLLDTPTGQMLCYLGVGLLSLGGFIIRQIINGIEV
ncbi:MAG TPA: type II secretion system F family protein [Acidobacteriaceae bacterium]|jgi:tight adherence protein B